MVRTRPLRTRGAQGRPARCRSVLTGAGTAGTCWRSQLSRFASYRRLWLGGLQQNARTKTQRCCRCGAVPIGASRVSDTRRSGAHRARHLSEPKVVSGKPRCTDRCAIRIRASHAILWPYSATARVASVGRRINGLTDHKGEQACSDVGGDRHRSRTIESSPVGPAY